MLADLDLSDMPSVGYSESVVTPEVMQPEPVIAEAGDMPMGVIPDMPNDEYHRSDALSRGGISILNASPTTYWYSRNAAKQIKKRHFDLGSCFSDLITFGKGDEAHEDVRKYYVREPSVDLRTNAGKEELKSFYELLASYQVGINHDDWDMILSMRDSAMMNALLRDFVEDPNTKPEHSHFCMKDVEIVIDDKVVVEQVYTRVRPDLKNMSDGILLDIKTLAPKLKWQDSVMSHGYDLQHVMYSDIVEETEGEVNQFLFAVTSKTIENPITKIRALDKWYLDRGEAAYRKGLAKFAALQASGVATDWFLPEITPKPRWAKD